MPDISMCANEKCPVKTKCYRYMAMPDMWQSYAMFEGGKNCKYFIKYRGKRKKRVKFARDPITMEKYQKEMDEIIKKGHSVPDTLTEMLNKAGQYTLVEKKKRRKTTDKDPRSSR